MGFIVILVLGWLVLEPVLYVLTDVVERKWR